MEVFNIRTNHKRSVNSYRKKAKMPSLKEIIKSDRKKSQKVREQSLNKKRSTKSRFMSSFDVDFETLKILPPFKGYWHSGCYGTAFPCMGCAYSAPLYGNHLPPSPNAIQCPTCEGWVYRKPDDENLEVYGCRCIEWEDE